MRKLKIFKSDFLLLFISFVLLFSVIIPVPYYVTLGGGIMNVDEKIEVYNGEIVKGSINSLYVKQAHANLLYYLLSYVIPSYEIERIKDVTLDEDYLDYETRERYYFNNSLDSALFVAYSKADKTIKTREEKLYVSYVDKISDTNLKVGDQIISVNGVSISSSEELSKEINKFCFDEKIDIEVMSGKTKQKRYAYVKKYNDLKVVGISVYTDYTYEVEPKINIDFSDNEAGPSGGIMLALSIYNKLVKEDITCGKVISGTGVIDFDGNVTEIGGVTYKLSAAASNMADVFIVPYENYEEALKYKKERKLNIKIIKVKSFDEALAKLKKCK